MPTVQRLRQHLGKPKRRLWRRPPPQPKVSRHGQGPRSRGLRAFFWVALMMIKTVLGQAVGNS